jgi:hypothetical protein
MTTLVNLGAAGAVIISLGLFLVHLRKTQALDREERESERGLLIDLIKNDLGHVGISLAETKEGLKEVKEGLKEVVCELRRRN